MGSADRRPSSEGNGSSRTAGSSGSKSTATGHSGMSDAEDHGAVRAEPPTRAAHARQSGVGNLPLAALTAQLTGRLNEQEQAPLTRMAGRQAAAVGVRRQRAAD